MQITARVHSVGLCQREAIADIDGAPTNVSVPMAAVELVTDGDGQSNPTFYLPREKAESLEPGTHVTITIAWETAR